MKKDVFRNFTKVTRKHLCQSLFFNKVACLRPVCPCIMKDGQTYFENNAVWTPQDFESVFGHFSLLLMKGLRCFSFNYQKTKYIFFSLK